MQLIVVDEETALDQAGADEVAAVIAARPNATLLVATGTSPMGLYAELARRHQRGEIETSRLHVVQLDEYVGVGEDDRRSLYGWMRRSFVAPLGVPERNIIRLPGDAPDPAAACRAYDAAIARLGGIDLAILGLGPNGHLGFNEPPSAADAPTRAVTLTPESVASNAPYWGGADHVTRQALTAGMTVLLAARRTLLVVAGAHKREILHRTLHGPVTPDVPASFLQQLPSATVLADRAAMGG